MDPFDPPMPKEIYLYHHCDMNNHPEASQSSDQEPDHAANQNELPSSHPDHAANQNEFPSSPAVTNEIDEHEGQAHNIVPSASGGGDRCESQPASDLIQFDGQVLQPNTLSGAYQIVPSGQPARSMTCDDSLKQMEKHLNDCPVLDTSSMLEEWHCKDLYGTAQICSGKPFESLKYSEAVTEDALQKEIGPESPQNNAIEVNEPNSNLPPADNTSITTSEPTISASDRNSTEISSTVESLITSYVEVSRSSTIDDELSSKSFENTARSVTEPLDRGDQSLYTIPPRELTVSSTTQSLSDEKTTKTVVDENPLCLIPAYVKDNKNSEKKIVEKNVNFPPKSTESPVSSLIKVASDRGNKSLYKIPPSTESPVALEISRNVNTSAINSNEKSLSSEEMSREEFIIKQKDKLEDFQACNESFGKHRSTDMNAIHRMPGPEASSYPRSLFERSELTVPVSASLQFVNGGHHTTGPVTQTQQYSGGDNAAGDNRWYRATGSVTQTQQYWSQGQQPSLVVGQQYPGMTYLGQQQPGITYLGQQQPGITYLGQQTTGPVVGQQQPGIHNLEQQTTGLLVGQQHAGITYLGQQHPGIHNLEQQTTGLLVGQQHAGIPNLGQQTTGQAASGINDVNKSSHPKNHCATDTYNIQGPGAGPSSQDINNRLNGCGDKQMEKKQDNCVPESNPSCGAVGGEPNVAECVQQPENIAAGITPQRGQLDKQIGELPFGVLKIVKNTLDYARSHGWQDLAACRGVNYGRIIKLENEAKFNKDSPTSYLFNEPEFQNYTFAQLLEDLKRIDRRDTLADLERYIQTGQL